jgi:NADP-dependent 3-hydroxy acid dehydrogenase YdfG
MKNMAGKVAFITGGASGLGLAMARSLSSAGMKVAIADIEQDALDAASATFSESNSEVIALRADVTDRDSMAEARDKTLSAFGKVHVVCNNAGVALNGNIADMTYKDWDWVMKVNLDGVINGVVTFIGDIKAHGEGGHFVNTSSIAGQYGMPNLGIYSASKFAVVGLSETMRIDLARDDIGVSVLCPGVVETGIGVSERNRPDEYGGAGAPAMTERGGPSPIEMDVMQPAAIGDIVLHAIQNDVFYILTHREFMPPVTSRSNEIAEAFQYWDTYRKTHSV